MAKILWATTYRSASGKGHLWLCADRARGDFASVYSACGQNATMHELDERGAIGRCARCSASEKFFAGNESVKGGEK